MKTCINSEIGRLEGVIIHTPGSEVENMTPENAERALYSDILNLSIASKEYAQLSGVLGKVTKVFEVKQMLNEILENPVAKMQLLQEICNHEGISGMEEQLAEIPASHLAGLLIEGLQPDQLPQPRKISDAPAAQPVFYPRFGHGNEWQHAHRANGQPGARTRNHDYGSHF